MNVGLRDVKSTGKNKIDKQCKAVQLRDIIDHRKRQRQDEIGEADLMWLKLQTKEVLDNDDNNRFGFYNDVKDFWKDQPCFVVGSSIGLKRLIKQGFRFSMLDGLHTIGMNHNIEDYDRFEWFIFQDKEFLNRTSYDLKKYKGRIFAAIRTGLRPAKNQTIFYRNNEFVSTCMEDGLFHPVNTGTLALNLAVISGANPIYMLGMDMSANTKDNVSTHFKPYPFEALNHPKFASKAFGMYPEKIQQFAPYAPRIFNVDPTGRLKTFRKIDFDDVAIFKKRRKINEDKLIICQVGTLDLDQMGEITRGVYNHTVGKHLYCKLGEPLPKANIYILECFKNRCDEFINFKKPAGSKVISIVHSSEPCMPALCSDKVITLTEYWRNRLKQNYKIESEVIYGAIPKNDITAEYKNLTFGRISRNAEGKFHPDWNVKLHKFIDGNEKTNGLFFVNKIDGLVESKHIEYNTDFKINSGIDKLKALSRMSVGVFAHGDFIEIFPLAVLEMMSVGIPIIALSQPSMDELIGKDQVICNSIDEVFVELKKLLYDDKRKQQMGLKAKQRAEFFSMERFSNAWNSVFRGLY